MLPLDVVPPEPAELTKREDKQLAKLLRKYEANSIIARIRVMQRKDNRRKRERGAPLKIGERIGLADEIDELADHYRRLGSKRPVKEAMLYVYRSEHAGQKTQDEFIAALKRKVKQGRREKREYRKRMEHLAQHDDDPAVRAEAKRRLTAL
jgi:CHASE2 domain-containing sensor protein